MTERPQEGDTRRDEQTGQTYRYVKGEWVWYGEDGAVLTNVVTMTDEQDAAVEQIFTYWESRAKRMVPPDTRAAIRAELTAARKAGRDESDAVRQFCSACYTCDRHALAEESTNE